MRREFCNENAESFFLTHVTWKLKRAAERRKDINKKDIYRYRTLSPLSVSLSPFRSQRPAIVVRAVDAD